MNYQQLTLDDLLFTPQKLPRQRRYTQDRTVYYRGKAFPLSELKMPTRYTLTRKIETEMVYEFKNWRVIVYTAGTGKSKVVYSISVWNDTLRHRPSIFCGVFFCSAMVEGYKKGGDDNE